MLWSPVPIPVSSPWDMVSLMGGIGITLLIVSGALMVVVGSLVSVPCVGFSGPAWVAWLFRL